MNCNKSLFGLDKELLLVIAGDAYWVAGWRHVTDSAVFRTFGELLYRDSPVDGIHFKISDRAGLSTTFFKCTLKLM